MSVAPLMPTLLSTVGVMITPRCRRRCRLGQLHRRVAGVGGEICFVHNRVGVARRLEPVEARSARVNSRSGAEGAVGVVQAAAGGAGGKSREWDGSGAVRGINRPVRCRHAPNRVRTQAGRKLVVNQLGGDVVGGGEVNRNVASAGARTVPSYIYVVMVWLVLTLELTSTQLVTPPPLTEVVVSVFEDIAMVRIITLPSAWARRPTSCSMRQGCLNRSIAGRR